MFRRDKRAIHPERIEVVVGPTANFHGDLECDGVVKIDGIFQGSIKTVSNVIISEVAKVDAHIEAQNVSVSGQAKGSILAKGRLEILSTGMVWADATVSSFLLDDGGRLHGGLKMIGAGPEPESFVVPSPVRAVTDVDDAQVVEDPASVAEKPEEGSEEA